MEESEVKKNTMAEEFNIGDKVRFTDDHSGGRPGDEGIVISRNRIRFTSGYSTGNECEHFEDWELISPSHKKGIMKTLSIMAKKLVDADVRTFVEEGVLDSELSITEEGKNFVLTQVLNANKKEYAAELRKNKAEDEKTEKGK